MGAVAWGPGLALSDSLAEKTRHHCSKPLPCCYGHTPWPRNLKEERV